MSIGWLVGWLIDQLIAGGPAPFIFSSYKWIVVVCYIHSCVKVLKRKIKSTHFFYKTTV
jgi:hypothetical protein